MLAQWISWPHFRWNKDVIKYNGNRDLSFKKISNTCLWQIDFRILPNSRSSWFSLASFKRKELSLTSISRTRKQLKGFRCEMDIKKQSSMVQIESSLNIFIVAIWLIQGIYLIQVLIENTMIRWNTGCEIFHNDNIDAWFTSNKGFLWLPCSIVCPTSPIGNNFLLDTVCSHCQT